MATNEFDIVPHLDIARSRVSYKCCIFEYVVVKSFI